VSVRSRLLAGLARQLGHPQGLFGRVVGARLDKANARLVAAAVEATEAGAGASVADVGFGGGVGLGLLRDRVGPSGTVHGVEISEEMLGRARRRFDDAVVLHTGSLEQLPLESGSIDGLVTTNTLYFVDDAARAFAEIARVLAPDGRAVIGVGDPEEMAGMPFTPYGFRLRPVDELLRLARSAGLELRDHRHAGDAKRHAHLLVLGR
jgi:arsenite methyltransferase